MDCLEKRGDKGVISAFRRAVLVGLSTKPARCGFLSPSSVPFGGQSSWDSGTRRTRLTTCRKSSVPFGGQSSWDNPPTIQPYPTNQMVISAFRRAVLVGHGQDCRRAFEVRPVISAFRRAVLVGRIREGDIYGGSAVISAFRRAVLVGQKEIDEDRSNIRSHQCLSAGSPRGTLPSVRVQYGSRGVISAFRRAVLVGLPKLKPSQAMPEVISAFRRAVLVGRLDPC